MRYKKVPGTDKTVSAMAIGTWAISGDHYGAVKDQDSIDAIHTMLDAGVNFIDTAPAYGEGASERLVGRAIKGYDRSKIHINSKFSIKAENTLNKKMSDGSYANCMMECERSLKNIGTDYLDSYIMHWPDPATPIEEAMRALSDLKKQGKILSAGVSNFSIDQIKEAQKTVEIKWVQQIYSMVNESRKEDLIWCESQGIAAMGYASLASGLLTGAIREFPKWDPLDYRYQFYDFYKEPTFSKCQELLKVLDEISAGNGHPLAQIAINWVAQKSYITTALCGVRNVEEAKENVATFEWDLTDAEMKTIDEALERLQIPAKAPVLVDIHNLPNK